MQIVINPISYYFENKKQKEIINKINKNKKIEVKESFSSLLLKELKK